jgi:hypothetical protein
MTLVLFQLEESKFCPDYDTVIPSLEMWNSHDSLFGEKFVLMQNNIILNFVS